MAVKVRERMMGALVILLVCLISTVVWADESYLCIGEHTVGFGFHKKDKTWDSAMIKKHSKWIVSKSSEPGYKWGVSVFGEKYQESFCEKDFNESGVLLCDGISQFKMKKENMRFLYIYPWGYWSDDESRQMFKEGNNTPYMEIGKCSKI